MSKIVAAFQTAVNDFLEDECMANGAALAYYTIFSLPPLVILVFLVTSSMNLSQEWIDRTVSRQIGLPTQQPETFKDNEDSQDPAKQKDVERTGLLSSIASRGQVHLSPVKSLGPISKLLGAGILLFSATGVFAQLQTALNRAWGVTPDPRQNGWKIFLIKRILSFGMIVVIAFLLLVSLVLTTLVDELISWTFARDQATVATALAYILNEGVSLVLAMVLFATMYKFLPDASMRWRDIWWGAFVTAVFFVIGKTVLGLYLQNVHVGSQWGGAATSLVSLLVWVYYTSLIVLFGAELTQAWTVQSGRYIKPEQGAVQVKEETKRLDGSDL